MKETKLVLSKITAFMLVVLLCISIIPQTTYAAKPELNWNVANLWVKETFQLKLKNYSGKVTWKSSNAKVATVSQKGVVTAKKAGKATITAKAGKKTYKCKVNVSKTLYLASAPEKLNLKVGETSEITILFHNAALAEANLPENVSVFPAMGYGKDGIIDFNYLDEEPEYLVTEDGQVAVTFMDATVDALKAGKTYLAIFLVMEDENEQETPIDKLIIPVTITK